MKHRRIRAAGLLLAAAAAQAGCTPPPEAEAGHGAHAHASPAAHVVVHKDASCGCCGEWAEHMRKAGFSVEERVEADMAAVKARVGLPYAMGACHTAEVAGYFVEGHVPAEDVRRLLAERPAARGLTVPGMPIGSPGMDGPQYKGRKDAYEVLLVERNGTTSVYRSYS